MPPGILAATGMLLVAALTPGPNNLVVLRAAARGDLAAVSSAIAGIVLGGVLMLVVVTVAADAMPAGWTSLRWVVASAGAIYLGWLGVGMVRGAGQSGAGRLPAGFAGLLAFQFLNPKGWAMVLALVAAFPGQGVAGTLLWLGPLFLFVPFACLLLWALAGRYLAYFLRMPARQRVFDRIMGLALLASTGLLLLP